MEQSEFIKNAIDYRTTYLELLEQLRECLNRVEPDFESAKIVDARIKVLNIEREIKFKQVELEEYKKRLTTK